MALVLRGAVKLYYYLNEEIVDQRTQNWFLMRTPWPGLALLFVYLMAVFRWLPAFMKDRQPYDLRAVIAVFNVVQIITCTYVFYQGLALGWLNHYALVCQPVESGNPYDIHYASKVCYAYFIIKNIDLLDTVFFVLRKKQNQVSFLHVYHHAGMVAVAWGMVKWVPGGHMTSLVILNSLVHIIMYVYYLLTVIDERYKKSLWWKKHVTQIQILQFSLLLVHFLSAILTKNCAYPRQPAYILLPQNLFMVLLFLDFYYRAYIKNPKLIVKDDS